MMAAMVVWTLLAGLLMPTTAPAELPVRQTSHLHISASDLADLPGYLGRAVPIGGNSPDSRPTLVNDKGETRKPITAAEWLEARRAGFTWQANIDNKMEGWYKQYTFPAIWLSQAKPSRKTFLLTCRADARITDWLPARLGFGFDPDAAARFQAKHHRPPVWRDQFPATLITDRKQDRVTLDDTEGGGAVIAILAYGDINADGIEDMLLLVSTFATQGTFGHVAVVTVTRTGDDKPVEILRIDD